MNLPSRHAAPKTVMAFARQIDDRAGANLEAGPLGDGPGHTQAPIEDNEGLAAAGRSVNHDEGLVLHPPLDQPRNGRGLGAKVIGWNEPVVLGRGQEGGKVVPSLLVIVGVAKLGWHDHAGSVLGRGLLGISLAHAGGIMVRHDDNVLGRAVDLAQDPGDGNEVRGGVGDDARAVRVLMDGCGGGEALGDVEGAGLVDGADLPEARPGLGAGVVKLAAVCGDVLKAREVPGLIK